MAGSGGTSTTLPLRRVTTPVPVWYATRCACLAAILSDRKMDSVNSSPLKTGGWSGSPPLSASLVSVTVPTLFRQASEDSLITRLRRGKPLLELIVSSGALNAISHGLVEGLAGDVEIEA